MEQYTYFDIVKIRESLHLKMDAVKRGKELLAQKQVVLKSIDTGYINGYEETMGVIECEVKDREKGAGKRFKVHIIFSRDQAISAECSCSMFGGNFYRYYTQMDNCEHVAAALQMLAAYLEQNRLGDATDIWGSEILFLFQKDHANQTISGVMGDDESIRLVPRLVQKDGKLMVSFKIGQKKMLLVKDLFKLDEDVRNSAMGSYGTSLELNHRLENFTEQGRRWIAFIRNLVLEEGEFENRLMESGPYFRRSAARKNEMHLFGWRLDQFYEIASGEPVAYENRDADSRERCELTCRERNPRVFMSINKNLLGKSKTFHGINVECEFPDMFYGVKTAYYIEGDGLYRMEEGFLQRIRPLTEQCDGGSLSFQIGRNNLGEFYYSVLPQIRDIVDITEENEEEIEEYLPPEAEFIFYLDAEDHNIACKPGVRYGDTEFPLIKPESEGVKWNGNIVREEHREREILFLARQWFPQLDREKQELHCGKDEECMYQVLAKGLDALFGLGEVQCTKRFSNLKVTKKMKMSVGVSIKSGLLNLDIATEDLPAEELLDILNSYRSKKKYHRLKSGDFVDLTDNSYEMLDEMMNSLHLSVKDFLKGNIELPMYRTLYLDKMLEENENVYSERDRHFKNLVRGFKTVNDSDFQLPSALARVLRNYQKNGYRWLRTLENFQFGGILADDMGLGKTLQVIAVLLSAKQEGRKGVSLVVAPASLVFNWGEEIHKFAPELTFALISGTQEERRRKLENYEEADVLITSYDLLKRDAPFYEGKEFLYQIIDEAQYIKNHQTVAAKAVKVIKSQTRFALTGTPIENRLSELWSIFDYLMPGFLYTYQRFREEIELPVTANGDTGKMERLRRMIRPFVLRRLKGDVLKDLPEKLEEHIFARMEGEQAALYTAHALRMKQMLETATEKEFGAERIQILAELTKLRQLCCDPALLFEDYAGDSAKTDMCMELLSNAVSGGHKILLFSQFTSMLERLAQRLEKEGISFYMLTGAVGKERRMQMVESFNRDDVPVFCISLKAGGTGLNLTAADIVIHYDPWWNVAVQNQATDRAHRIGQKHVVTVYKLVTEGTVEEKIIHVQERKWQLAEQILEGGGMDTVRFTREELLELLG